MTSGNVAAWRAPPPGARPWNRAMSRESRLALLKTAIFTIVAPGTVTVLIPYLILSSPSARPPAEFGTFRYLGGLLISLGFSLYLWCGWDFAIAGRGTPAPVDPPKELVVRGPYRYVRNPMYIAVLSVVLGEALLFQSRALLRYGLWVFLLFFLFVLAYEEPVLRRKFGESYRRYCASVPRWLPIRFRARRKSGLQ